MKRWLALARRVWKGAGPGNRRGFALVLILLILVMVSALGTGYLLATTTESQISAAEVDRVMAQNMAESGIAWALNRMKYANWLNDVERVPPTDCLAPPGDQIGHYLHTTVTDDSTWRACPSGGSLDFGVGHGPELVWDFQFRDEGQTPGPDERPDFPPGTGFRVWAEMNDEGTAWLLRSVGHSYTTTSESQVLFRPVEAAFRFSIFADRHVALASFDQAGTLDQGIWSNGELELSHLVTVSTMLAGADGKIGVNPTSGLCDDQYVASVGHFSSSGTVRGNVFTSSADGYGPDSQGSSPFIEDPSLGPGTILEGTLYLMKGYQAPTPPQTNADFETAYQRALISMGRDPVDLSFGRRFNPHCRRAALGSKWSFDVDDLQSECTTPATWSDSIGSSYSLWAHFYYCASAETACGASSATGCLAASAADSPYPARAGSCGAWTVDNSYADVPEADLEFESDPPLSNVLVKHNFPTVNYAFLKQQARTAGGPGTEDNPLLPDKTYFTSWQAFRNYILDGSNNRLVWDPTEPDNPHPGRRVVGDPAAPGIFYIEDPPPPSGGSAPIGNFGGLITSLDPVTGNPHDLFIYGTIATSGWLDLRPFREDRPRNTANYYRFDDGGTVSTPPTPPWLGVTDGTGNLSIRRPDFRLPAIAAKGGLIVTGWETTAYSGSTIEVRGLIYAGPPEPEFVAPVRTGSMRRGLVYIDMGYDGPSFQLWGAIVARDVEMVHGFNITYNPLVQRTEGFEPSRGFSQIEILSWRTAL